MMPLAEAATPTARGGPQTPEGKARSAQNARRHGLRAQEFGLAPHEDPAEWGRHLAVCEQGYGPADEHERNLVHAIAAAMWNEIRADRMMAEVMARIPPGAPGHGFGSDAQEPAHALSLGTAIRYQTAAGMAAQRAQRAYFAYRRARLEGLIQPRPTAAEPANQNYTNELPAGTNEPGGAPGNGTDDLRRQSAPQPILALRARLDALLQRAEPASAADLDLLAAIRALKLPGAAPYHGPIDLELLDQVLAERRFDVAGLAWLAGFGAATVGTSWRDAC